MILAISWAYAPPKKKRIYDIAEGHPFGGFRIGDRAYPLCRPH
jgi:hypothetical protein